MTSSERRALPCLALAALLFAAPAGAEPTPKQQAELLLRAGNALYDRGSFEAALVKYRLAMELYPSFKLRLNLGLSLAELGRHVDAATELDRYLREGEGKAEPAMRREAEKELARVRLRVAELVVDGDGAVSIDGEARGPAPVHCFLPPGAHRLRLDKGGERVERAVELWAGKTARVVLVLRVAPGPPTVVLVEQPSRKPARRPAPTPFYKTWWFWTAVGVVVATGVTVGAVLGTRSSGGGSMPPGELDDVR
jgi:hypothetical protein